MPEMGAGSPSSPSSPWLSPLGLVIDRMHVCMRVHPHTHRHTPSGNSNTAGRQPGPWGSLQTSSRGCEKGVRAHVQTEPGSAEGRGSPSPRGDKGQRLALHPLCGPCADERSPAVAEGGGGSTEHRGLTPAGEAAMPAGELGWGTWSN